MTIQKPVAYRAKAAHPDYKSGAIDPITTEIVRHSLNSAANQMKRALVRTAFSPIIYEVLDFAAALYDRDARLLAQAPSLPAFMGTLNFCIEEAVKGVGGEAELDPGDIILYNFPYGTGSHPQDAAMVMPAFTSAGELIGYAAIKAHWLDIGGKAPYSTDTVDVFQEGTVYPGVKLYARGEPVRDIQRIVLANTRFPKMVAGDVNSQTVGVRKGAAELVRVVERFGVETFRNAVERMFDHGETIIRSYFERIPDGRYVASGCMDNDGINDDTVPFEIAIDIKGSDVRIDFSNTPATLEGPTNCPLPSTVSGARVAIAMLAGGCEAPNDGFFRPVEIVTRPGTMFHPLPPAPCFLYGWALSQAIETIYKAMAKALPEAVPASSAGDICGTVWWGVRRDSGEPWSDGSPHPIGQGAHAGGDGGTMIHVAEAATRFAPIEVSEAKNPWLFEKVEFAPDSGGAGQFRGGLGVDFFYGALEESLVTVTVELTKTAPWGLMGGEEGKPNGAILRRKDGSRTPYAKKTGLKINPGDILEIHCGGGGGFGPPSERDPARVKHDLAEGYISEAHAHEHYSHAFKG